MASGPRVYQKPTFKPESKMGKVMKVQTKGRKVMKVMKAKEAGGKKLHTRQTKLTGGRDSTPSKRCSFDLEPEEVQGVVSAYGGETDGVHGSVPTDAWHDDFKPGQLF